VPSEEGGAQETVSLSGLRLQGGTGRGRGRRARERLAEPRWEGRIEAYSYALPQLLQGRAALLPPSLSCTRHGGGICLAL